MVAADSVQDLREKLTLVTDWFDERIKVLPDRLKLRELRSLQRRFYPETDFGDVLWDG
jgi:hypothetical protein